MLTPEQRREHINRLRRFPAELENLVKDLTEEQLITRFIPGEWAVVQIVHHLADSHMNAFIRCKLLLLEDNPTIRPYNQEAWAEAPDGFDPPIQYSLTILRGLHHRWVVLFENLQEADWARPGIHPEIGQITLDYQLKSYSEHCDNHIAQIRKTLTMGM